MIPHLQQQIEFLTACRDHGAENVEWACCQGVDMANGTRASERMPLWKECAQYEFRVRPRKHVIPRAEIPAEDPKGKYMIKFLLSEIGIPYAEFPIVKHYRTEQDRTVALYAMLAREEE